MQHRGSSRRRAVSAERSISRASTNEATSPSIGHWIERLLEALLRQRRHERRRIHPRASRTSDPGAATSPGGPGPPQGSQTHRRDQYRLLRRWTRRGRARPRAAALLPTLEDHVEEIDRQIAHGVGFVARIDNRQPRTRVRQQARGRPRGRDRHAHAQAAIGGGAPELAGDRRRVPEEARQPAQVERDLTRRALCRALHLDARRELARHVGNAAMGCSRSVKGAEHKSKLLVFTGKRKMRHREREKEYRPCGSE